MLLEVARRPGGMTVTEVAQALEIAVPTAHHLLGTLRADGLLARDDRCYVLGPRIGVLADAFLREGSTPGYLRKPLRRLAEETGETAYLTAWRDGEIHALETVEGEAAVRVGPVERGRYHSPHARATGKLLLAFARPELRRTVLGSHPLTAHTTHTIVDRAVLEAELAEIRERGWAEDREEFVEGVSCVAAPALLDGVVVASYTVAAPSARFDHRRDALLGAVRRAAADAVADIPTEPTEEP